MKAGTLRLVASLLIVTVALASCGRDEADYEELQGQVGAVNGAFDVRLAKAYRSKIDSLQTEIESIIPGTEAKIQRRFGEGTNLQASSWGDGKKLSDLFHVEVPSVNNTIANQKLFSGLRRISGATGPYFEVVDTEKYVNGPQGNYVPYTDSGENNDPRYEKQYYLEMIRYEEAVKDIDGLLADAAPVVVAVLDTGVAASHEDLENVMWKNADSAVGYDPLDDKTLAASESTDTNGHGTHVAGIIAGEGKNGAGIHGIAAIPRGDDSGPLAEVMNVPVLNDNGSGTSEMIGSGMRWAADQHWKQKENDEARSDQKMVMNMSLGGPFETDGYDYETDEGGEPVFEDEVINYATSKDDVLVVVAAGNESCGLSSKCDVYGETYKKTYYYPCSYENVLCVAATTHDDKVAGFSNRIASVGIAAPGWQILSTIPGARDSYGWYNGTSQAAPVVSGAAAVVWSLYPQFDAGELKQILRKSAATIGDVTDEFEASAGRLDLAAALAYAGELADKGVVPKDNPPSDGIVKSDKVEPSYKPQSEDDPYQKSEHQVGGKPEDKGKGSGQGCGIVGGRAVSPGWALLFLMGLAPVFWEAFRKRVLREAR